MPTLEMDRFYDELNRNAVAEQRFDSIWKLNIEERPPLLAGLGRDLGFHFTDADVSQFFSEIGLEGDQLTDEELELVAGGAGASTVAKPICNGSALCRTCCGTTSVCKQCSCPKRCI